MKTFIISNIFLWLLFVISDAIILGIFNLIGIIATLFVNYLQNKKIEIVKKQQEAIGVQIDGKMDELLDINKKASKAEGHLAGKAEEKSEQAAAVSTEPTEVIVVKPAEVIVVNKDEKKLDK